METHPQATLPARPRRYLIVLEYLELFVLCLGAILVIFTFCFRICNVSGDSMNPTLRNGQILLVSDLSGAPEPGDIIIFHQTSQEYEKLNEPLVKRVIAVAGQTIEINYSQATVRVDGELVEEDYIQLVNGSGIECGLYSATGDNSICYEENADGTRDVILRATVPEGHLFVMGDNRNRSWDSRYQAIGFVDERRVLGKVFLRLAPWKIF